MIGNNTGINVMLKKLEKTFRILLKKNPFCHWFVGEGMELGEF